MRDYFVTFDKEHCSVHWKLRILSYVSWNLFLYSKVFSDFIFRLMIDFQILDCFIFLYFKLLMGSIFVFDHLLNLVGLINFWKNYNLWINSDFYLQLTKIWGYLIFIYMILKGCSINIQILNLIIFFIIVYRVSSWQIIYIIMRTFNHILI